MAPVFSFKRSVVAFSLIAFGLACAPEPLTGALPALPSATPGYTQTAPPAPVLIHTLTPAIVPSLPLHPPTAMISGKLFFLEIADTPEDRAQGLMGRAHLPLDRAMLFVFSTEGRWSFWMKNTVIPLDIIWFSRDGTIVDIQTMQPASTEVAEALRVYSPRSPALYALEMNAGLAKAYQFSLGTKVALDLGERRGSQR